MEPGSATLKRTHRYGGEFGQNPCPPWSHEFARGQESTSPDPNEAR